MKLDTIAPAGWDARIAFPLQSSGFAEASCALGYRPLFAADGRGAALVLVRQVPVPFLAAWTARAKVYAHATDSGFLPALVEALRQRGISHVRLGDSTWGLSGAVPARWPSLRPVAFHAFVHDLKESEDALLAGTDRMIRRHLRKFAGEVTVAPVSTAADLRDYLTLAAETGTRMREREIPAVYPAGYIETIFRRMVPRGQAVLFLARAGAAPLAGATFVTGGGRCAQIHGCSTRDRALTPKQGPTLLFWHAMRYARAHGWRTFDMGAVTPTEDPRHPHRSVYEYKKLWGGRLVRVHGAELVVSAWKHGLQEALLAPLWDRLHPLYLRLFADASPERRAAPAMLELSEQKQCP
jgi:hypothetical protein